MSDALERVKSAASHAQPSWTPERAAANELALLQRRARHERARRALVAASAACLFAALFALSTRLRHPRENDLVRYTDGSTATAASREAELEIAASTPELIESLLTRGGYQFRVVKDPRRLFRIRAGVVRVEVLGTEFRMDRVGEERVRVEVLSGRVRVAWNDDQVELTDGEAGVFPRPMEAHVKAPAADQPELVESVPAPPGHGAAHLGKGNWVRLAQAGDYDAAYSALKRSTIVAQGPVELMLAADAARLSHHAADALQPLRALLSKYPHDPRAPLAAFTLGRVLLDDLGRPREAASTFAQARALAPRGPLVEDALAREVEAWSRSGDLAHAHERAEEYLSSYPQGIHARSVRRFGGVE